MFLQGPVTFQMRQDYQQGITLTIQLSHPVCQSERDSGLAAIVVDRWPFQFMQDKRYWIFRCIRRLGPLALPHSEAEVSCLWTHDRGPILYQYAQHAVHFAPSNADRHGLHSGFK